MLVISYCLIFLSIYLASIAYAGTALYLQKEYEVSIPQPIVVNAFMNAISSFSLFTSIPLLFIIVIIVAFIIFLLRYATTAMGAAV